MFWMESDGIQIYDIVFNNMYKGISQKCYINKLKFQLILPLKLPISMRKHATKWQYR